MSDDTLEPTADQPPPPRPEDRPEPDAEIPLGDPPAPIRFWGEIRVSR